MTRRKTRVRETLPRWTCGKCGAVVRNVALDMARSARLASVKRCQCGLATSPAEHLGEWWQRG